MDEISELSQWKDKIFSVDDRGFEALALEIFAYQKANNAVYNQFISALPASRQHATSLETIPFLPISFFKTHEVMTGSFQPERIFESSGTTGMINSRHLVKSHGLYTESFEKAFDKFYEHTSDLAIIGLLPSYLERKNSSLVDMVDHLIKRSGNPDSGFYLREHDAIIELLRRRESQRLPTLVIGVTFALLDLADQFKTLDNPFALTHTIIMETGGMKGRRKEMIRAEVHQRLKQVFTKNEIHSEYGMTELLSQAYSCGEGIFKSPSWMKILLRDEEDPFTTYTKVPEITRGIINVIDLANFYSCSFIATDDAGKLYPDERFEVIGRVDNSDLRGCTLMVV